LVVVQQAISGTLSLDAAAAAIGSANDVCQSAQSAVFVVCDSSQTWTLFQSSGNDAEVSATELTILAHLIGAPTLQPDDFIWTG
jgi:hypothetical protein